MSKFHTKQDKLRVIPIPVDPLGDMGPILIENKLDPMQKLVGGYIEVVSSRLMPKIDKCEMGCCRIVMVVNEEGRIRDLPYNERASRLYPGPGIYGDVFLVLEGMVYREHEGYTEPDFLPLPEEYTADRILNFEV